MLGCLYFTLSLFFSASLLVSESFHRAASKVNFKAAPSEEKPVNFSPLPVTAWGISETLIGLFFLFSLSLSVLSVTGAELIVGSRPQPTPTEGEHT